MFVQISQLSSLAFKLYKWKFFLNTAFKLLLNTSTKIFDDEIVLLNPGEIVADKII